MKFQETIEKRRSIRQYTDQTVTKEQIEEIIKAAQIAPTWKNSQTGRFHVVCSQDMKKGILEKGLPERNAKKAENAVLIVTSFVKNVSGYTNGQPDNELGNGWGAYDLGLASENLVLKAADMGLGTLIMGIRSEEAIRAVLNIPEEEIIVSVIALGYPDIEPVMPPRKPTEDVVKYY